MHCARWALLLCLPLAAGCTAKTDTAKTAGGAWHTLEIFVNPVDSANAEVTFGIDASGGLDIHQVRENGANPRTPNIKHMLALSGLAEMHVVFGAKAGGANAEALLVDYISVWQKR